MHQLCHGELYIEVGEPLDGAEAPVCQPCGRLAALSCATDRSRLAEGER